MKNRYLLTAYDFDGKIISTKEHTGSYSSEIRGWNQMQRYLNRAMSNFLRDTGAKKVTSRFLGN